LIGHLGKFLLLTVGFRFNSRRPVSGTPPIKNVEQHRFEPMVDSVKKAPPLVSSPSARHVWMSCDIISLQLFRNLKAFSSTDLV
jgi:hypothetical protein